MYTSPNGSTLLCPDRRPGALTIVQGEARYTTATGHQLDGTVGSQGELALRMVGVGGSRPLEMDANGSIDGSGVVHARQRGPACSYDFIWQKQST